jgi:lipopolysaccharide export system protein LptA
MKYRLTRYKTLTGNKEILELTENVYGQWIIYQNKKPKFHINCFDFESESNQVLNSWLLAKQKSIREVLSIINKKNNTNLTIEKAPFLEIKVDSMIKEFHLKPLPLEWVS